MKLTCPNFGGQRSAAIVSRENPLVSRNLLPCQASSNLKHDLTEQRRYGRFGKFHQLYQIRFSLVAGLIVGLAFWYIIGPASIALAMIALFVVALLPCFRGVGNKNVEGSLIVFNSNTLKGELACRVDKVFCDAYNSFVESNQSDDRINQAGTQLASKGYIPVRSIKVIVEQIKAATTFEGEDKSLQNRMVTKLYKELCCDLELLPFARELRKEFPDVFPENLYTEERTCTQNARVGKINTVTGKGEPRAAYLLEASKFENSFKQKFRTFSDNLGSANIYGALEKAFPGCKFQDVYSGGGRSIARNIRFSANQKNECLEEVSSEFKKFALERGFIATEQGDRQMYLAFNPGYASAYLTKKAAEHLHHDSNSENSVTISALTSSVTDDANPGGGLLFVKKDGGRVGTVRDGHVMVFESDAYHGSDQNQLWKKSELKKFEALIDRLEEAINGENKEEKDAVIREVRALQAARVSRILSKTEFDLYKEVEGKQTPFTRQERVDFLDAFNEHWQGKLSG